MGIVDKIFDAGIGTTVKAIGGLARDIRSAITGKDSITSDQQIRLIELSQQIESATLQAEKELSLARSELEKTEIEQRSLILQAEIKGGSWMQRNWRPLTMLVFVYIVANNYIIVPYARCFYSDFPIMDLPPYLWDLLKIGLGGYVVGRSAEKISKNISKK